MARGDPYQHQHQHYFIGKVLSDVSPQFSHIGIVGGSLIAANKKDAEDSLQLYYLCSERVNRPDLSRPVADRNCWAVLQAQVAGLQSASAEDISLTLQNTGYAKISWEIICLEQQSKAEAARLTSAAAATSNRAGTARGDSGSNRGGSFGIRSRTKTRQNYGIARRSEAFECNFKGPLVCFSCMRKAMCRVAALSHTLCAAWWT